MKRVGEWWVPDAEELQLPVLAKSGWQLDHLAAALSHVSNFRGAVDGGAHVGTWTVAMAARFKHVTAFEPAPDTHACLERNVVDRRLTNVDLSRFGLGESKAKGFGLGDDTKYHGGNTGGRYLVAGAGDLATVNLDRFPLPLPLDFLKLDLEGFELFALRGAQRALLRDRPIVLLEDKPRMAHRFGLAPHSARDYALGLGMKVIGNVGADWILGW